MELPKRLQINSRVSFEYDADENAILIVFTTPTRDRKITLPFYKVNKIIKWLNFVYRTMELEEADRNVYENQMALVAKVKRDGLG